MSTGRVLWLIWCLLWAGVWVVDGIRNIPHQACVMDGVCFGSGNWWAVVVCAVLAQLAVAAFWLPVGRR